MASVEEVQRAAARRSPEEIARLKTLLRRSDALGLAVVAVAWGDWGEGDPKDECVRHLQEMSREADEAFRRYRDELGFPQ